MRKFVFLCLGFICCSFTYAQKVAVLEYNGGGDWYGNPTALPNLVQFCNQNIRTKIDNEIGQVKPTDPALFSYAFIHMTGHGNVYFSEKGIENLRRYLLGGGFLHIDDNYGMYKYLLPQLKRLFPEKELQELPASHKLFQQPFNFPKGLPKIHEHDGKRPQALGIFDQNRLILLYTFESDLGDGWESPAVHGDPAEVREKALKMGANIIHYAFKN